VFIKNFFIGLFRSFINIYDDKGVRESYGDNFADSLGGADPVTGKRRVSIQKVLFRIVILAILAIFILMIVRINTSDSFWLNR
jgi:hypothetical protein